MNYDARIDTAEQRASAQPFDPLADPELEAPGSQRKLWIGAIAALAVIVAIWFWLHSKTPDSAADKKSQAPTVSVVTPGQTTIAGAISGTGTLAPRREIPVGSVGEGGQVAQVLVDAGEWVRQGQVLAYVDRSVQVQQRAGISAQIQVAQADARLAQANLDRASKLVERGFISKADIDRLTATRDAANARVRVAGAQYNELGARIQRLNIVAPASGLLLERNVEPGQVVSAGSGVLFRIAKDGEMELLAKLGEVDLAKVKPGTAAQVTPVGAAKSFAGTVWQVAPTIDQQTRQGTARVALSYSPEIKPGGFASVVLNAGTIVAPRLPDSALLSDNKGSYVFIVDKDNKAQRRNVKTGMVSDSGIAIVEGLDGNERVVARSGGFLSPGETVNPKLVRQ